MIKCTLDARFQQFFQKIPNGLWSLFITLLGLILKLFGYEKAGKPQPPEDPATEKPVQPPVTQPAPNITIIIGGGKVSEKSISGDGNVQVG